MSIQLKDIKVDVEKTLGAVLQLVEIQQSFVYKGRERTNQVDGYKYIVLCPGLAFEKISVKVKSTEPIQTLDRGSSFPVSFENLEVKLYQDFKTRDVKVSATATSIMKVEE